MPQISDLPAVLATSDGDLIAVSQGGTLRQATRAQIRAGLQTSLVLLPNQLLGRTSHAPGEPEAVALGAGLQLSGGVLSAVKLPSTEYVYPEDFGALGDGYHDDSAAIAAAAGTGRPVRFGPKTYAVSSQWTIIEPNMMLLGTPGLTTLRRIRQDDSGAWIAIQADGFVADGIVFDANHSIYADSWGVIVTSLCSFADFHRCVFTNAMGATMGHGLVVQGGGSCRHSIRDCEFSGNTNHGLWVQAVSGTQVIGCRAHNNGKYGICVDFNDVNFKTQARFVHVVNNRAWDNIRGISIGNFNSINAEPPVWGNSNPDALLIIINGNICHNNSMYGISVAGEGLLVTSNMISNNGSYENMGAGILANVANSQLSGNMITGPSLYGIDCGGAASTAIVGNHIRGAAIGINCGGSQILNVSRNTIQDCTMWSVMINNTESDGHGIPFPLPTSQLEIFDNSINFNTGGGGVWLRDGPQYVTVARNRFLTPDISMCLRADTDSIIIEGNHCNATARVICNPAPSGALQQVIFPDICENVMITAAPQGVQSMVSAWQAVSWGKISFIRIKNGGSGYTNANINFPASAHQATAQPVIVSGTIIGAVVTNPGSGYGGPGTILDVSIVGDGAGATAQAYATPPLPEERRLVTRCNCAVSFTRNGSMPLQENSTGANLIIPANGQTSWTATWGMWRASV